MKGNSMSRIRNMTVGSPAKLLLSFALPLILTNLGQQLYMIVDAIIVGQGVGVEALAAVGATDWTYWLALWVMQALTQGFAILIAQHFGEGSGPKVKKAFAMTTLLCGGLALLLTGVCLLIAKPMLHLLETPEHIFDMASDYLITMFSGILVVMAYNLAASILRALGDGRTPLIAMAIAAVTNVALDLLFVLVFHWGVVGAAAATVTAQLIAFCYCLVVLKRIELLKTSREDWRPEGTVIKRLITLGFPLALQHVLIAGGGMILQSAINQQGLIFIAGLTATNKIFGLLDSSAISLGFAITTYMAQNYGAGRYRRIRLGMRNAALIATLLSILIALVMFLGGRFILGLFIDASNPHAGEVLTVAYRYLSIISAMLPALYLLYVFRSTLQGLGSTGASLLSGFMEFLVRVFAALIFVRLWGSSVILFAEPSAWLAAMAVLALGCIRRIREIPRDDLPASGEANEL